jgi:hypothetical protein
MHLTIIKGILHQIDEQKYQTYVSPEHGEDEVDHCFEWFVFPELGRVDKELKDQACSPKYA